MILLQFNHQNSLPWVGTGKLDVAGAAGSPTKNGAAAKRQVGDCCLLFLGALFVHEGQSGEGSRAPFMCSPLSPLLK
ncbi:Uncharacterized protein TCM_015344 [Theobroma cacao]|uniref:Uncharacterized protein n=1 Tax=Theobroma cacao TaxID=3641 RepID=A0A061G0S4_THECC|nr:Uncharacterized protein TCM_015344 [Theobroma cacao]